MSDIDDYLEDVLSGGEASTPKKKRGRPPKAERDKAVTKKAAAKEEPSAKPSGKRLETLRDDRKLTSKGRESMRQRWGVENRAQSRSLMMQSLLNTARDKFGTERVFGTREELDKLAIGIPTPSLAFEYLIANDIFPLSSVLMLAGSWGSCKSALSYEFFRWFYELSGIAVHIDTEDKFDADFACDIMRVPRGITPIISNRAGSVEQMQQILTHYIKDVQKNLTGSKDEPGPGTSIPCVFCIDSLAGATSEEIQEKIMKEGNAGRAHPISALKNSHYLPAIKKQFDDWPFTLLVVNHLKEKLDEMGNTHQYTLGGQTFNFHESFELRNSVWKSKFKNAQFEGIGIKITCAKNSFGPTGRKIKTRFLWWIEDDEATGEPRDVFLWDWNWSICTLLNEMEGIQKQRLKARDLVITCKSPSADVECLANFPAVGMSKTEYLPFQEVGQLIQDNHEVSERIRDALNIKRRFKLDRPFSEIKKEYLEQAD